MTNSTDMMTNVPVSLGSRSYDVKIGTGMMARAGALIAPHVPHDRTVIVTDSNVASLHLAQLETALRSEGINNSTIIVPAGEKSKNWEQLQMVVEGLLAAKIERDDPVIALGGGVIGDLVGFAAAILRRGVPFIQIPTTLLAQVDSSVGGKTAINSGHGKNLIGAFHQPALVLADIDMLATLDQREFLAGYAEVVKYGLLGDAGFFEWLELNGPALSAGEDALRIEAVARSVQAKADIVARDETERGDRALLNLGHTFGHALEAATGYTDRLLHGEGVSIGTGLAFDLSARLGLCPQDTPSRVQAHFERMGLKRSLADIQGALPDAAGLFALMGQDKKVRNGVPAFILAHDIGKAFITREVQEADVIALLEEALTQRSKII